MFNQLTGNESFVINNSLFSGMQSQRAAAYALLARNAVGSEEYMKALSDAANGNALAWLEREARKYTMSEF